MLGNQHQYQFYWDKSRWAERGHIGLNAWNQKFWRGECHFLRRGGGADYSVWFVLKVWLADRCIESFVRISSFWSEEPQYLKTQLEAEQDLTNAFVGNHQLYKVLPRLNLTKFAKEHQLPHTSLTNKIAPFFDYSFSSSRHPLIRLLSAYHSKFSIYNPKISRGVSVCY